MTFLKNSDSTISVSLTGLSTRGKEQNKGCMLMSDRALLSQEILLLFHEGMVSFWESEVYEIQKSVLSGSFFCITSYSY